MSVNSYLEMSKSDKIYSSVKIVKRRWSDMSTK